MTAGYVYEVRDADAVLLYVGASRDVFARIEQHYQDSWWADELDRVRARVFPSIERAREVERQAIHDLAPRYNLAGLPPRRDWSPQRYVNYLFAKTRRREWEGARGHLTSLTGHTQAADHLLRLRLEFERRFGYAPPVVLPRAFPGPEPVADDAPAAHTG